jgi:hypothetical protein
MENTPKKPRKTTPKTAQTAETKAAQAASSAVKKQKTTIQKVIAAGKATSKIVANAGGKILATSIQSTKNVADIYAKAGKKALELGKDVVGDTAKIVSESQDALRKTSAKALKETIETLKESDLMENPLKKEKK